MVSQRVLLRYLAAQRLEGAKMDLKLTTPLPDEVVARISGEGAL